MMINEAHYNCDIIANVTVREAFDTIIRCTSQWWMEKFEGSAENVDDIFIARFGEAEITIRTIGFVPGRKILWRVIDSSFPNLQDKIAWTDTKIVWEFLPGNNKSTLIKMTHIGLTTQKECYNNSVKGWEMLVKENLVKLLSKPKVSKPIGTIVNKPAYVEADMDEYTLVKAS